ncbi:MAG: hypothetical protein RL701_3480 [Pseudomonadota bacterium]
MTNGGLGAGAAAGVDGGVGAGTTIAAGVTGVGVAATGGVVDVLGRGGGTTGVFTWEPDILRQMAGVHPHSRENPGSRAG